MERLKRSLWIFDIGFRRMSADLPAGWMAHMGVFSTFGLLLVAAVEFGLPMAWPLAVFGITRALPIVMEPATYLLFLFLVLAVIGFALGLVQGKRIRGRALELVAWFFWIPVAIVASMALLPDNPVLADWVAPVFAVLSVVVLLGAGLVAIMNRNGKSKGEFGVRLVRSQRRADR